MWFNNLNQSEKQSLCCDARTIDLFRYIKIQFGREA